METSRLPHLNGQLPSDTGLGDLMMSVTATLHQGRYQPATSRELEISEVLHLGDVLCLR